MKTSDNTVLKIALAQINPTVGALKANSDLIGDYYQKARQANCDVIIYPELALCGYPPEDLLLKKHFLAAAGQYLKSLAQELSGGPIAIIGYPEQGTGAAVYNSAAVIAGGQMVGNYRKLLLPNYGVFDEQRYFVPGEDYYQFKIGTTKLMVSICEDIWPENNRIIMEAKKRGVDILLNLSSSPFHRGKGQERRRLLQTRAIEGNCAIAYVNLVGGQDELVFDGHSLVVDRSGGLIAQGHFFAEQLLIADIPMVANWPPPPAGKLNYWEPRQLAPQAEVIAALELGLTDYARKSGFRGVVLGLSGGIDSALTAVLAVRALGADNVMGISMPSPYSSLETRTDARRLADNLGIAFQEIPIREAMTNIGDLLAPHFASLPPDSTEENIQARLRGLILMAFSNKFGWLLLSTGNKSEVATGYCTLYGDMAGGFNLLKDVPKTLVFELAHYLNEQAPSPLIPTSIITRPPSAELKPNQTDQDTLPPYAILDAILELYVGQHQGLDEISAAGFDRELVGRIIKLVDHNEYKRRQSAPGVKITPVAFGKDRRMPVVNGY